MQCKVILSNINFYWSQNTHIWKLRYKKTKQLQNKLVLFLTILTKNPEWYSDRYLTSSKYFYKKPVWKLPRNPQVFQVSPEKDRMFQMVWDYYGQEKTKNPNQIKPNPWDSQVKTVGGAFCFKMMDALCIWPTAFKVMWNTFMPATDAANQFKETMAKLTSVKKM